MHKAKFDIVKHNHRLSLHYEYACKQHNRVTFMCANHGSIKSDVPLWMLISIDPDEFESIITSMIVQVCTLHLTCMKLYDYIKTTSMY